MTARHPYLRRRTRPAQDRPSSAGAGAVADDPRPSTNTNTSPGTGTGAGTGAAAPVARGAGLSLGFDRPSAAPPTAPAAVPTATPPASRTVHAPADATRAPDRTAPTQATVSERVLERRRARASRVRPFPAPDPADVRMLGPDTPVVRVDRRRSAVGALRVSGATSVAWETVDGIVGATTSDGRAAGRDVQTPGNRPLVGFHDGDVVVALRHVRSLRRALVMARGDDRAVVSLHDGTVLAVDAGDPETMTITALSVLDGELELRAEPFPRASHDGDVFAAFGFVLSAPNPRG